MVMTAAELLAEGGSPTRGEIREYLSGNYCRCTGYQAIVDAVEDTLRSRSAKP
jgi:carbon-monoxide dehydrogenase small subunit